MPHQLGLGGSGFVESSSHKWRRKILKLTQEDYEYQQGILTPGGKPERSDFAIDNTVFSSRYPGHGQGEKIGRQVRDANQGLDRYSGPIETISRSEDGRFKLGDPDPRSRTEEYMTLDPNTHVYASHIQGSHGNEQLQNGRQKEEQRPREIPGHQARQSGQCHMQSNWNYVQFYHPQYYLMQQEKEDLAVPLQRVPYPDAHQAAMEAQPAPGNDENGFYPQNRASINAGLQSHQDGRQVRRRRLLQPSGGQNDMTSSQRSHPRSGRTGAHSYTVYPPIHDAGAYSAIQEPRRSHRAPANQRRSRSADNYYYHCDYGNYANYPVAPSYTERAPFSRSRPTRRDEDYVRMASRSAPPTSGSRSHRSRSRDGDPRNGVLSQFTLTPAMPRLPQEHHYDQMPSRYSPDKRRRSQHTPTRGPPLTHSQSSTPHTVRSRGLSTPHSRRGTPGSRATSATPGADYKSFLTSSPDMADGSNQPFIISDVSSVLPGSSLMTSSNQMASSLTSPSFQMAPGTDPDEVTPSGKKSLTPRCVLASYPEMNSGASKNDLIIPPGVTPDGRNHSSLHQRSLSEGDGSHWKNPQRYLYSGTAPLADERVDEGIYSPRTMEFMNRYIADEDIKAHRGRQRHRTLFPPLQTHFTLDNPADNVSSPEELAYTREKLNKAIKHVRKGRLQPNYGFSAPELDSLHQSPSLPWSTPRTMTPGWGPSGSFASSVAPYKSYNKSKPTSGASSSGRGSDNQMCENGSRFASHTVLQIPDDGLKDTADHSGGSKDTSHSTSGVGSKDTSRSVSSQDGPTATGEQDHAFPHQQGRHSNVTFTAADTPCDDNDERPFDGTLEAKLLAKLKKSRINSHNGATGRDIRCNGQHDSPEQEEADPNESVDEKFERLRREYHEFQRHSQEHLDEPSGRGCWFDSESAGQEIESEML